MRTQIRAVGLAALVLAVAASRSALAQTGSGAAPPPEHGSLSLLLNIGGYSGFGGGLALGTRAAGIRGLVGWAPVIFALDNLSGGTDYKFYSGLQAGGDVYLRIFSPKETSDIGAQLGYRYSSLLGHGFAVGGYAQFALNRSLDFNLSIGLLFFPDGEDRLKQDQGLPSSTSFAFPGPKANFALSVGLAFWP